LKKFRLGKIRGAGEETREVFKREARKMKKSDVSNNS